MSSSVVSSISSKNDSYNFWSYKLISSSYAAEWDYGEKTVYSLCKRKAPLRCSWTEKNPGRRFHGCGQYLENPCNFHVWHDPNFCDRAKEIVIELKKREKWLYNELKAAKNEVRCPKENAMGVVEAEIIEENLYLTNEISVLRKKFDEGNGKKWKWLSNCLGCFLVVLIIVVLYA